MKQVSNSKQSKGTDACSKAKQVSIRIAKSLAVFALVCSQFFAKQASSKDWPLPQVQFGYTTMRAKLATDHSVFSALKKAGIIGEPNDRAGELFMSVGLGNRSFLRLQWNVTGYENWGAQFAGNYYGVNNNWDTNDYAIAEYNLDVPPLQTGIYWHTLVDEVKVDQVVQSVGLSYGRHLVEYGAMSIDGWAGPALVMAREEGELNGTNIFSEGEFSNHERVEKSYVSFANGLSFNGGIRGSWLWCSWLSLDFNLSGAVALYKPRLAAQEVEFQHTETGHKFGVPQHTVNPGYVGLGLGFTITLLRQKEFVARKID